MNKLFLTGSKSLWGDVFYALEFCIWLCFLQMGILYMVWFIFMGKWLAPSGDGGAHVGVLVRGWGDGGGGAWGGGGGGGGRVPA